MINDFKGARLKDVRILRALTLTEVAKETGITKQAISQYENETIKPEYSNIIKLSQALDVPYEYFFLDSKTNLKTETTYFRSLLTSNKKYRLAEGKKMEIISSIYLALEEYIEFPEPKYPALENLEKLDQLNCYNELDFFEEFAQQVRDYWKIPKGPIDDLKFILEFNGIIVITTTPMSDTIDAYSQKLIINGKERLIIAISSDQSSVRAKFDMAHELAHCLLHTWTEDLETLDRVDFKDREKQANMFASAFLLPKNEFIIDILNHPTKLDYYLFLKNKWGVSIQAIIYRANALGLLSENQYIYLMRQISKKGYRKKEPLDKQFLIKDSLINVSIEKLITGKHITVTDLLNTFAKYGVKLYNKEISEVLNINEEILEFNNTKSLININISQKFS